MADSEKQKRLKKLENEISKRFGPGTVMTGKEAILAGKLTKQVLPTPSAELNKALHCGGLSGIVDLFGPESSGKTSLAIEVLAKAQKSNPDFVGLWLETEESITPEILEMHGVDTSRLIYIDQKAAGNAENSFDVLRAYVASNDVNLFVINSVAGLSPKIEIEEDLTKQNPAVTARIMSKLFRTMMASMNMCTMTMIFINQERENIGQMFGNPAQATGGRALKFFSFQRIRMSRLKIKAGDPLTEDEGIKIGFNIYKNRFAKCNNPYMKGEFYARYNGGIDSYIAIPAQLVEAGIVERKGSWYNYLGPDDEVMEIGGVKCKFQSQKLFIDALKKNKELFEYFTNMLSGEQMDEQEIDKAKKDEADAQMFAQEEEQGEQNNENIEDAASE